MGNYIVVAIIILAAWIFTALRSKTNAQKAFNVRDEAEPWMKKEGITHARFSVYEDPLLAEHSGASILVGFGDGAHGNLVGFAVEVKPGLGVVSGARLEPYGVATHHRTASQIAKVNGTHLVKVLQEMAHQHRLKHST